MSAPIILVAGLARCGSTLTMHMLRAGGIPCVGTWPAYEVDEVSVGPVPRAFLDAHAGHAMKWLCPYMAPIPEDTSAVVIWLDRNPRQQARSHAKFLSALHGFTVSRNETKRIERSFAGDKARALAAMNPAWPRIFLRFEDLVTHPEAVAERLAAFLVRPLDVQAMAGAVLPRAPKCQPDLSIEVGMLEATAEARSCPGE